MQLKEVVQWMLENNYMVAVNGKYRVTAKFNKEMTGVEKGLIVTKSGPMVLEAGLSPAVTNTKTEDWTSAYIQFISDAQVPSRSESSTGSYDVNKYSEPGMKAFKKAIESGVIYAILVKSTMLYYKTHKRYAVKIGNYMSDGIWRTDYETLKNSVEDGTVADHIKSQIDDDKEYSKFKLG